MITGCYRIADKTIRITSIHNRVQELCRDYSVPDTGEYDIDVVISEEDIQYERTRSTDPGSFDDPYMEELAVYRKIAVRMTDYDTFLMHGSVIAVDGYGYMFTAASGTGKSTHARLWREYLGDRAVMVNDDKPLIKVTDDQVTAYGTPYNGKHRQGNNISVPLKAICVLTRGEENSIREASSREVYHILLQQTFRPAGREELAKTLKLIDKLTNRVKFYILKCNMDISAAKTSYNAMKG